MFIRFSLHQALAESVQDHPNDPFNKESEFYQTWQLCSLDPIDPNDKKPKSNWARQGFSATGGPDDGVAFGDGSRRVVDDPTIAFKIDPKSLADGQTQEYRLDLHWWESDSSSQEVRAAFSDATLSVLVKAWNASAEKEKAALSALKGWVDTKSQGVVKTVMAAASVTASSWVGVGFQLLPLFELIVDAMKSQSDDYIGMHQFVISTRRQGDKLLWRVIPPGLAIPDWHGENSIQRIPLKLADGANRNRLSVEYACVVLE